MWNDCINNFPSCFEIDWNSGRIEKQSGNCWCDHIPFFVTSKLKSTAIRRTAVRETLGIMGDKLSAALKPLEHHSGIVTRGFRGTLNWSPITPRGKFFDVNSSSVYLFFFFWKQNVSCEIFRSLVSETIRKKCFLWCFFLHADEYKFLFSFEWLNRFWNGIFLLAFCIFFLQTKNILRTGKKGNDELSERLASHGVQ